MAGKLSIDKVQLGDSATATNNFVLQTNVDGSAKLARGNAGATSQDILTIGSTGAFTHNSGIVETKNALSANNIDLSLAGIFTKTISGATTLTVSNVPAAGFSASFVLDLTNGGSAAITWWSGVKWAGGTAPTLTSAGRDVLGFFTHDGGTTWSGLVMGKDVK